jgi:tRNA A-37 threonylcarbamoyl transferase component Bud32
MDDLLQRLASALADRYRIESEIGSGGMALVYLATDLKHDRRVALKVMRPQLAHAIGTDRFLSEIQIMARLDHPHIVPLLDSGETRGFLYFVMPYVAGETLRERLQRDERLPVDEVLRLTRELASALDYAHEQGVVHRDIKPANIFMQSGHARLADFGIAHAAGEAGGERLTATGMSVGTPAYMSPEQAGGDRDVDTRSDIYSLACVTYEMLSGTPPFAGSNSRVVLAKHLNEEAPDITAVRPEAGRLAASALAKALQKLPKDRQATTGEYADDLERGAKVPRRRKRRVGRTAAALAVVALATVMAWIGSRGAAETDAGDPAEAKVPIDPNLIAVFPLRVAFPDTSLERLEANVGAVLEVLFDGETGPRAAEPFMVRRAWEELTENGAITPTDEELRWTAADLGYGQMLTGTVSGSGSLVQVVARIEGTVDGRELGKASIRAPSHPDSMYRIIDELGIRLAGLNAGEPEETIVAHGSRTKRLCARTRRSRLPRWGWSTSRGGCRRRTARTPSGSMP